ncbi:MAG: Uma2 family endonuclease [Acidobacteria bacterium]|nr:Uma2 family endonuclease [Acidobacteriota bacterium]MCA1648845.1 Uma2 family endonuclease [Acidobacteriota bacterium]
MSPVDVVFDEAAALVLQPDVIFISGARLSIIGDRVWGPPDMTMEVLSPGTARRDRTLKIDCYRRYGVRESWLLDPVARAVEVFAFDRQPLPLSPERFEGASLVRSRVLPRLRLRVSSLFEV